jgi:hypothetical protein
LPEDGGGLVPHVPKLQITKVLQNGRKARISFDIQDDTYAIRSYQVYVNGVPCFADAGRDAQGKASVEEEIELSPGPNRIEVSCMNAMGVESYREMWQGTLEATIGPELFYVGIGVSKYRNPSLDLGYADKDAKDLANLFSRMGKPFSKVSVLSYVNEKATRRAFQEAGEWLAKAGVNDTVVVFLGGHGVHDIDADASYYFLTHETVLTNLSASAASFDMIEDLMGSVRSRQKLLLLDTCESGELDEEPMANYLATAKARGIRSRGVINDTTRGLKTVAEPAASERRSYLTNRDRLILADLTRRTGTIVFSASRGNEMSYESDTLRNGYFTAGIVRALSKDATEGTTKLVTSVDLRQQVIGWVETETGGIQHPTVDRDNVYQLLAFPSVTGAR